MVHKELLEQSIYVTDAINDVLHSINLNEERFTLKIEELKDLAARLRYLLHEIMVKLGFRIRIPQL